MSMKNSQWHHRGSNLRPSGVQRSASTNRATAYPADTNVLTKKECFFLKQKSFACISEISASATTRDRWQLCAVWGNWSNTQSGHCCRRYISTDINKYSVKSCTYITSATRSRLRHAGHYSEVSANCRPSRASDKANGFLLLSAPVQFGCDITVSDPTGCDLTL